MKFIKMHGLGNDYLYVYGEVPDNIKELSRALSERHFGAGSDGMIYISPSEQADFRMRIFNADGSEAKMCGNGIRCVGKYVFDLGYTDKTELAIDTLSGIKYLKLNVTDGAVQTVEVNMGIAEAEVDQELLLVSEAMEAVETEKRVEPQKTTGEQELLLVSGAMEVVETEKRVEPQKTTEEQGLLLASGAMEAVETEKRVEPQKTTEEQGLLLASGAIEAAETEKRIEPQNEAEEERLETSGVTIGKEIAFENSKTNSVVVEVAYDKITCVPVSVGNPHAVIFVKDAEKIPLETIGPKIEHHPAFPDGVNTEFVQVISDHELRMRVWERGSGITMACGTGACASACAAVKKGFCKANEEIMVHLDGGDLRIVIRDDGTVYMTGPAEFVYEGTCMLPEFI